VTSIADSAGGRRRRHTRITLVVDSAEYGGAEAYVIHLLRHLPEEFARTLVATPPVPKRIAAAAVDLRVPVVTVDSARHKLDLGRLARQARAIRATRPDLVHVNLTTAGNSRHVLAALATSRTPAVATLHSVAPIRSALQLRILRQAYRRLDRAIAVSEETRQQLVRELHVDASAVRLVANGVEAFESSTHGDGGVVRIGALGRLTREKGFDLLIDAVRRIAAEQEVVAAIGGEGIERRALERQAAGAPVELPGVVDDVPAFLNGLDVFCLPSRWEGLPFALLEAMMAGLPCVAADVGDVASALGDTGMVVPPEDVDALVQALKALVASRPERHRLGSAARARAREHYSAEAMVRSTMRVYAEALAGRSPGA
jgi:glycosyltransferase involved in cell wall biosynthesis